DACLRRSLRLPQGWPLCRVGPAFPVLHRPVSELRSGRQCLLLARRVVLRHPELSGSAGYLQCAAVALPAKRQGTGCHAQDWLLPVRAEAMGCCGSDAQLGTRNLSGHHRGASGTGPAACAPAREQALTAAPGPVMSDAFLSDAPSPTVASERLRITEIFHSLQGESDSIGWPTVFVRLTGCPLRCVWGDTEYSFHGGEWQDIEAILSRVEAFGAHHVCVTGGEPLAQKRCLSLLVALCDRGHEVSLETSGALDIAPVDPRVRRVVDLKAPGSGEV